MAKGNHSPKPRVPNTTPWQDRTTVPLFDAAKILGIGRSTAYQSALDGEIPVLTFGRRKLVPVAWLKRAVEAEWANLPKPEAA